ncbi:MAG: hypothetical protein U0795_17915 [Pirellulales bacterium]
MNQTTTAAVRRMGRGMANGLILLAGLLLALPPGCCWALDGLLQGDPTSVASAKHSCCAAVSPRAGLTAPTTSLSCAGAMPCAGSSQNPASPPATCCCWRHATLPESQVVDRGTNFAAPIDLLLPELVASPQDSVRSAAPELVFSYPVRLHALKCVWRC